MENLGKRTRTINASITNGIQDIEEKISNVEDTIEEIYSSVKENDKVNKILTQNFQEI